MLNERKVLREKFLESKSENSSVLEENLENSDQNSSKNLDNTSSEENKIEKVQKLKLK